MQPHPYQKIGGMLRLVQVSRIVGFILLPVYGLIWLLVGLSSLVSLLMPDMLGTMEELLLENGAHAADVAQTLDILPMALTMVIVLLTVLLVVFIMDLVSMGQLLKRNANFVRTYEIMLIVLVTGLLTIDFMLIFTMGVAVFLRTLLITLVVVAAAALVLLYAARSVRLRTFMGSDEYFKRNFFLKKVTPPQPAVPDTQPDQTNPYH